MIEGRPYRVETAINAPRAEAWQALTEPERVRRWFGWDREGLDEEIRLIFTERARPVPPGLIEWGDGRRVELEPDGPRVIVRAIMPGPLGDADWDDIYYDINGDINGDIHGDIHGGREEDWHASFEQLRFVLETRPEGDRHTVHLSGVAPGPDVVALAGRLAPGRVRHRSRHVLATGDGPLVVVRATAPLTTLAPIPIAVTVSTYGLDDVAFKTLAYDWADHWERLAADAAVTAVPGTI